MAIQTGTDMRGNVRIVEIAVEQLAKVVRFGSEKPQQNGCSFRHPLPLSAA
jgi:hypothetical protein